MPFNLSMASSADMYVLLYSASQDCFHIETVAAMVESNILRYLEGRKGDYITLAFGSTVEELYEIKRQLVTRRNR